MASAGNSTLLPPPLIVDNTHKHYDVAIICILLGILGTSIVVLRLWYRYKTQAFGADDYAMIPAVLLYIAWTVMAVYVNLSAGVGKPLWEVTLHEFSIWFKGIIGSAFLYPALSTAIRTSIILFYERIFSILPRFRLITRTLLLANAGYLIAFTIVPGFICKPLYKAWHPLQRETYCSDIFYYDYSVALYSISVVMDWLLFSLPIWPVTQLVISQRKRFGLLLIFMFGASACIAATFKLALFVQQWHDNSHIDPRWIVTEMSRLIPPQFNKYGYTFWIPSQVEPTVAMIGTSLPALGGVFVRAGERINGAIRHTLNNRTKISKTFPAATSNHAPSSFKNYNNIESAESQRQKKIIRENTTKHNDDTESTEQIVEYAMNSLK